jgi:hypothetical protein
MEKKKVNLKVALVRSEGKKRDKKIARFIYV